MLYKHKEFIFGIGVVIIERGLDVMDITIPSWLGPLLLVIGGGFILWAAYMTVRDGRQIVEQSNQPNLVIGYSQSNILRIERKEPSNIPPWWFSTLAIIASLLLLAFATLQTYLVISGVIVIKFNWEWIVFYLLFGAFPLWLLLEPFTFDRKYYKSGRSAIAVDATFIVKGNVTDVFNRCSNILEMMKSKIVRQETPNLIKVHLNKSKVSLEVSPQGDDIKVYVLSDATWVTVKVGKGRNQRIIDEFQKHFLEEFREPYKQPSEAGRVLEELSPTPLRVECNEFGYELVGKTWLKENQYLWHFNVMLTNASDTQPVSTKAISLIVNYPNADGDVRSYVLPLIPNADREKYGRLSTSGEPLRENEYLSARGSLRGFYQFLDVEHSWRPKLIQTWPALVIVDSFDVPHRKEFSKSRFASRLSPDKEGSQT